MPVTYYDWAAGQADVRPEKIAIADLATGRELSYGELNERSLRLASHLRQCGVHKGDRVVLEVRQGGLIVRTVVIARDSGEPGKTIAVKNQTSGREVIGKVVNAGLVRVLF